MYAKVFTSMWDGSLYGQLEASAVLMACVTLCNAQGVLDMTPEAISGRTGWPLAFIKVGLEQLQRPDTRSRTDDESGCRLVLLDTHRDWGWLIVNYEKYRTLSDPDTVREQNKIRAKKFRDRRNAASRCVTVDNARSRQAEAEAEEGKRESAIPGLDVAVWRQWYEYRKTKKPITPASITEAQKKLASFGDQQAAVVANSIAEGYQGLFPIKKTNGRGDSKWE